MVQVCGQGQDVDGDAVVPNCSAFLEVSCNTWSGLDETCCTVFVHSVGLISA